MGGTDEGINDALQVHLNCSFVEVVYQGVGHADDVFLGGFADGRVTDRIEREGAGDVVCQSFMRALRGGRFEGGLLLVAGFSDVRIRLKAAEMADCCLRVRPETIHWNCSTFSASAGWMPA
jgi:hypothetical protein